MGKAEGLVQPSSQMPSLLLRSTKTRLASVINRSEANSELFRYADEPKRGSAACAVCLCREGVDSEGFLNGVPYKLGSSLVRKHQSLMHASMESSFDTIIREFKAI
ncbi:hypothetical protein [Labrys miyagiensis]|uniref:hypothetical protein n=1 Tax=Labrys miyagiensis TaxID=346912 RepID=UPI0024E14C84|nr:hypothetical protein [Labrys miyagiensis]